jgi:hypothetical protein
MDTVRSPLALLHDWMTHCPTSSGTVFRAFLNTTVSPQLMALARISFVFILSLLS